MLQEVNDGWEETSERVPDAHHGEQGLVGMDEGRNAFRRVELKLRARLSKPGFVLGCCKHWDVENLAWRKQVSVD